MQLRKRNKGFTLVELLVVVLILAILMAVALPLYLDSVRDASKKSCRANMQSIANAAQAWKVKTRASDFSTLTDIATLSGDLGSTPFCPDNGTYAIVSSGSVNDADGTAQTVPTGGFGVTCDYDGAGVAANAHGGFIPGVTSN